MFTCHPQLKADTHEVCDLELCRVVLMNDKRYTWLILIPMQDELVELTDLSPTDQHQLMDEIAKVSQVLTHIATPDKINVGALGNMVPQLHIHVMARHTGDPAWPGPVWGHSPAQPYDDPTPLCETLKEYLTA